MQQREKNFSDIGTRLRSIRKTLDLTLDAIYQETNISKSYVSEFENGFRLPTAKYLKFLGDSYKVSMDFVFYGLGEPFLGEQSPGPEDLDFGKHDEDVMDMLFHMANVPTVMFDILGYFSEIKVERKP